MRRQLQVIEQEAVVLRTKIQSLEVENEKLLAENKKMSLLKGTKKFGASKDTDKYVEQIATLEVDLSNANKQIAELKEVEAKRTEEINTLKNKINTVSCSCEL